MIELKLVINIYNRRYEDIDLIDKTNIANIAHKTDIKY